MKRGSTSICVDGVAAGGSVVEPSVMRAMLGVCKRSRGCSPTSAAVRSAGDCTTCPSGVRMGSMTLAQNSEIRSGIDLGHVDERVRPQDDLFEHVNGRWLAEHEIPADRALDGAFRTLADKAEVDVRTIIEEAAASGAEPGTDAQKIGDLYTSFMDTATIEAAGLDPIREELRAVSGAADRAALAAVLGGLQRAGVTGALAHYVDTDSKNSERYLMHVSQGGLGLPDESY